MSKAAEISFKDNENKYITEHPFTEPDCVIVYGPTLGSKHPKQLQTIMGRTKATTRPRTFKES